MAQQKAPGNSKRPVLDPAMCRCCRSLKKCRILTVEYEWMGNKEIYSDMFMDCFGLLLTHLDGDSKDTGICATCVVRLRDAIAFRQQVLQCEQNFINSITKQELVPKIEIKIEAMGSDSDYQMDDTDDVDYTVPEEHKPPNVEPHKVVTRARAKQAPKKIALTKIKSKVADLSAKLDSMLEKPAKQKRTKKSSPPSLAPTKTKKLKPVPEEIDNDKFFMTHSNAVTMAQYSYICPFNNRISNYYCYYCKDQFMNPQELRDHTMTHDPMGFEHNMEYKKLPKIDITRIDCRLCDERITSLESLKEHLSNKHGKKIYPVTRELLTFKLELNSVSCTECGLTFPYFDALKKHMIEHFGTYICDQCGACFLEQNSLRTHIKGHNKVEANFPCEICGKNLKSKYSRYLHIATVHEKKATVNCYKCEASFLSYALRNKHLIEVHGDKRMFPCKQCDKVYNRRKTLMEHIRRNHLKVFRHQCDLCEQRFYLPSRLREHMATHTGERNYKCEYCEKSYPRLQSLQEHKRSHSNDRRFKCDVCHSTFTQNCSLKSHMKSHHQGYEMENFS